ncbi:MAG: acetyl-CoA carboxylase biotin carboxylase subunit [bacterium]
MNKFNKILIANRGEIAVRIIRSAKKLGISTVAIYSEVDRHALHVRKADESYCIGQQELSETYLNIDKIIDVAKRSGCGAIHPGYGFLSENAKFVKACEKAGIIFIGPKAEAIRLMGNKIESREFVGKLGIPMTRGLTGSPEELLKNARKIPLPVLVKAAAGGGGKGMRIVNDYKDLKDILETTSREAKNYFGDEAVYIEKYVEEPRHIEFQVLGDNHGNVVHLFERECTIQRRYQKIIEESPSPTLTPEVREKMGESAVAIAKAVGYNSAGTVEFLVDHDLNYYFLEMNTRIQVEHPVTEMVTGTDLIEEQILVAQGNPTRLRQEDLEQKGHAIECRIYAEDPENNFMPSPGMMSLYSEPAGEDVRVDSGIDDAMEIHSFFDPMIAKLVVWGANRDEAALKSITALNNFIIQGIKTNISYLRGILEHEAFLTNTITTKFCDEHTPEIIQSIESARSAIDIRFTLLAYALHNLNMKKSARDANIWEKIGYWRNNMELGFEYMDTNYLLKILRQNGKEYIFQLEEEPISAHINVLQKNRIQYLSSDHFIDAAISMDEKGNGWVTINGFNFQVTRKDVLNEKIEFTAGAGSSNEKNLFSPMPGKVLKINVKEGDTVKRGTIMLVVEAMKMENNIVAEQDAIIEKIAVRAGDMVDTDLQLIFLAKENTNDNS